MIKYDEVNIHKCFPAVLYYFCLKYGNLQILFQGAFSKKHLQIGDIGAKNEIDRDIIKHNIILLCFTTFVCKVILFLIASLRITIYSSAFCFMCHVNSPKCYLDNIKFRI